MGGTQDFAHRERGAAERDKGGPMAGVRREHERLLVGARGGGEWLGSGLWSGFAETWLRITSGGLLSKLRRGVCATLSGGWRIVHQAQRHIPKIGNPTLFPARLILLLDRFVLLRYHLCIITDLWSVVCASRGW